jgi:hypothetical protein
MTLERARGHDGWRARRPDLSQPSQAARSRNSASAPRYERPMSRRPGASAVATPTSTGQNAEVLTDAASAIAVGKRRRCTSRSQSGGPQPTGDRERNRPPVAPELGKQTRAEGQEMTPALYTAGASRPSVGTRPGSCGKRAFVDSRASTVAANDQAEAGARRAESWLLLVKAGQGRLRPAAPGTIQQSYRFHGVLLWTTVEPHDSSRAPPVAGVRTGSHRPLHQTLATRYRLCANEAPPRRSHSDRQVRGVLIAEAIARDTRSSGANAGSVCLRAFYVSVEDVEG